MEISRYLVELLGYCSEGSNRLLVYEIVSNNSLQFHLHGESLLFLYVLNVMKKKRKIHSLIACRKRKIQEQYPLGNQNENGHRYCKRNNIFTLLIIMFKELIAYFTFTFVVYIYFRSA